MIIKEKIKVIKKGEIKEASVRPEIIKNDKKTKQVAAREMVSTVTNWVTEFQSRKREETKIAIETLFKPQPQTN